MKWLSVLGKVLDLAKKLWPKAKKPGPDVPPITDDDLRRPR